MKETFFGHATSIHRQKRVFYCTWLPSSGQVLQLFVQVPPNGPLNITCQKTRSPKKSWQFTQNLFKSVSSLTKLQILTEWTQFIPCRIWYLINWTCSSDNFCVLMILFKCRIPNKVWSIALQKLVTTTESFSNWATCDFLFATDTNWAKIISNPKMSDLGGSQQHLDPF